MTYEQSQSLAQVRAKHPFPWKEQRMNNLVRMLDAAGNEVILFEMTALCAIFTRSVVAAEQPQQPQQEVTPP